VSQQINLFNPVFLQQQKHFSLVTMLQALGAIVLGSALIYGYAQYQVHQLELQSVETARRYADEQARLVRYAAAYSPQQASRLLEREVKEAEAQVTAQQELINTLKSGAIGNTSGYSEYMRALARQVVPGLWLTGFTITGDAAQMTLSGGVTRPGLLPAYVRRLNHEGIMRGKSFASLQMQQPKAEEGKPEPGYVEFTLQSVEPGEGAK